MKPFFIQRIFAFILDFAIIALVAGLIAMPFNLGPSNILVKEYDELTKSYLNNEIDETIFLAKEKELKYQIDYASIGETLLVIVLSVGSFVVLPLYNNGQTLGKRMMKIRIVSEEEELSANQLVLRSFVVNDILASLMLVSSVMFLKTDAYYVVRIIVISITSVLYLINVFMIAIRKDGKGLHDLLAKTKTIKVNKEV